MIRLFLSRITGEPLFGNPNEGLIYTDEQLGYGGGGGSEQSPSALQTTAGGFAFRPHPTELGNFLSAAVGHQQIFHGAVDFHPDESDDDDDDDDDEMSEESDDVQSDGDESSVGELDE